MFAGCVSCATLWREYARTRAQVSIVEKAFREAMAAEPMPRALDLLPDLEIALTARVDACQQIRRHALESHPDFSPTGVEAPPALAKV